MKSSQIRFIVMLVIAGVLGVAVVWQLFFSGSGSPAARSTPATPRPGGAVGIDDGQGDLRNLATSNSAEAAQTLQTVLSSPDADRAATAAQAMGLSGQSRYQVTLEAALTDERPAVRAGAMDGLRGLPGEVAVDQVQKLLSDQAPPVRAASARYAGARRQWGVLPELISLMEDPDPEVRGAGYAAVTRIIGRSYTFDPQGSPAARAATIASLREHWGTLRDNPMQPSQPQGVNP